MSAGTLATVREAKIVAMANWDAQHLGVVTPHAHVGAGAGDHVGSDGVTPALTPTWATARART